MAEVLVTKDSESGVSRWQERLQKVYPLKTGVKGLPYLGLSLTYMEGWIRLLRWDTRCWIATVITRRRTVKSNTDTVFQHWEP